MKTAIATVFIGAVILLGLTGNVKATMMADPAPDFDNPRQIVLSLSEKDEGRVNAVLSNAMNIQKFYGTDNVNIAIVAYGPGIWSILNDSHVRARVESMQVYEITFIACGNTLTAIEKEKSDMIVGVEWVQAGLVEIVERRLSGWVDLSP